MDVAEGELSTILGGTPRNIHLLREYDGQRESDALSVGYLPSSWKHLGPINWIGGKIVDPIGEACCRVEDLETKAVKVLHVDEVKIFKEGLSSRKATIPIKLGNTSQS